MTVPTSTEVADAVEANVGGRVVAIERQRRWRPTWFLDVERDGEVQALVVRGDRFDAKAYPLRHEYTFHRLMEAHGFAVPKLHAYLDGVLAIDAVVMDRVPGRPDFDGTSDADRDQVVDEYLQQLARLHQMDPAPFVEAGIKHPAPGEDPAMIGHGNMEERFRARKRRPDPFMEFCLGWMRRHMPYANGRVAACVWDSGQFHHQDGHLVAILDLEFGHVGDPLGDITVWRMRDTLIPFGDMVQLYARYEELTGTPVDLEAVKRHHFASCIGNQLMFGPAVLDPQPDTDLMTYMQWNSETNLMATDFLGEYLDVDLPTADDVATRATREAATFAHLVRTLGRVQTEDLQLAHDLRLAFRMARHLQRRHEIGDQLDAADVDDVGALLGRRPRDWFDGEQLLEEFVLADAETGRHDAELAILFHQRNLRTHMALGPRGSTMTRHYQCQRFDGGASRIVQL